MCIRDSDTLSMWYIRSMEDFEDAALNIVLPHDKLGKADFLVIEEEILKEFGVEYKESPPDKEYIKSPNVSHYNMINLRVNNISKILSVYKKAYEMEVISRSETYVIQWSSRETVDHVYEAIKNERLELALLNQKQKDQISKKVSTM